MPRSYNYSKSLRRCKEEIRLDGKEDICDATGTFKW